MTATIRISAALALCALAAQPAQADLIAALSTTAITAPASLGFSASTTAGTLTVGTTSVTPYNFLDSWTFTLAADANVGALVGSFNFTDGSGNVISGVENLQLRLRGPGPSGPVSLVTWQTVNNYVGFQTLFSYVMPTVSAAGTYALEVRGTINAPIGGSAAYSGTLSALAAPVPLPAAAPLLALALAGLAAMRRKAPTQA